MDSPCCSVRKDPLKTAGRLLYDCFLSRFSASPGAFLARNGPCYVLAFETP